MYDEDDDEHYSPIRDYYRYRTCPACRLTRMVVAYDTDSFYCPHNSCGFTLTGKADRTGGDAILTAVEAHNQRGDTGLRERLEAIERRLTRLEETAAYNDRE